MHSDHTVMNFDEVREAAAWMSSSRKLKWLGEKLCRLAGFDRAADLLYVRRLEGFLSRPKVNLVYQNVLELSGPGEIAEIGSWKGKSTVALALAVRRSGRTERVYAIDHHHGSEEHRELLGPSGSTWPDFQQTLREAHVEDLVVPLKMKSTDGARWLAEHGVRLKFLLVDGAHDEESVAQDLRSFLPLCLSGCRIALDDAEPETWWPGVYRAYERVLKHRAREIRWAGKMLLVELLAKVG